MECSEVEMGVLCHPEAGTHPGIVLIHDVWGLSDHTRDLASRLARAGFSVLGIDLYREMPDRAIEDPSRWIQELCDPEIQADIEAAARFLADHPASRGRKVGVVGFCMGGMYALFAGCGGEGISASVSFYGLLSFQHGLLDREGGLDPAKKPREPIAAANALSCPLLAFFGEEDPYITGQDVRDLEAALSHQETPSQVRSYPAAGHAFANDSRPDAYRPEAATDAWDRMLVFLEEHLAR